MRLLQLLTIMSLAMVAQPALAQTRPDHRLLTAANDTPWTHQLTKMVLPATAAGLTRREIRDLTSEELDLYAGYDDPARDMFALVYVYRTGLPDVAIWFDQAVRGMETAPGHGLAGVAMPAPSPFARPGGGAPSGLRLTMDVPGPGFKSMAIAIAPLGDWLVKIQMASKSLDRAALDAKLGAVLEALGWPAEAGTPHAAAAMLPCATPLRTKQAKIVRDDMTQMLMNSVMPVSMEREGPPPVYCREPGLPVQFAVYRANGDDKSYVVALSDSGLALSVGPAFSLDALMSGGARAKSFSMTRLDRNGTSVLPSFNRLPPPQQAVSVALASTPMLSTTTRVEPAK